MDSLISYTCTYYHVLTASKTILASTNTIMYLLLAKQYWQAQAKILKILIEYFTLFCSFSNKTYIFNVNNTELTRTIFRFPFLNFILNSI